MATTGTMTARQIITQALRKARFLAFGEEANADDATAARDEMNVMLKGWQNKGYNLWTKASMSVPVTTAASYTLDPVRPLTILSARFKRGDTEAPMEQMTRDEYDGLPVKTSTGQPTQFYYDRQREAAVFYVWPVMASTSGETIEITYDREVEDITDIGAEVDVPGEWWDAVIYNLAARLGESVPSQHSTIVAARAEALLRDAGAFDREGSVYFAGPWAD